MKRVRYLFEGAIVFFLINLFRILPVGAASSIGGLIGQSVGPLFSAAQKRGMRNLRASLPGKTDAEYNAILKSMWNNLGRTFAEYPHLEKIARTRTTIAGEEHIKNLAEKGGPGLLIAGHLANWEVSAAVAYTYGVFLNLVYRAPNNPYVAKTLQDCRTMGGKLTTFPKSAQGMREIFAALKQKKFVGILVDQKYNQGLEMPFFGRPAMTSPAFAQLAQRFDCPVLPARVERLENAKFHITVYPSLITKDHSVEDIVGDMHILLEEWITARPDQWLWIHNRWREK